MNINEAKSQTTKIVIYDHHIVRMRFMRTMLSANHYTQGLVLCIDDARGSLKSNLLSLVTFGGQLYTGSAMKRGEFLLVTKLNVHRGFVRSIQMQQTNEVKLFASDAGDFCDHGKC